MANTYVLIASNTLSSSAASVTFSSIPATYTDLVLKFSARSDYSGINDSLRITFNSDTATNYSWVRLNSDGSTPGTAAIGTQTYSQLTFAGAGDTATSNTFSNSEVYIPNYTVSQNKPFGLFGVGENNNATAYMAANAMLWRNTATISSLRLIPNLGTNFLSGSSFFLYGIKNS